LVPSLTLEEKNMTQGAISGRLSISGARRRWAFGLLIGLVGGVATLQVSPLAAAPELVLLIWLAAPPARPAGPAGILVGHGAVWSWLLVTSSVACAGVCRYTLAYGPAHVLDASAWQTETRVWFGLALCIFLVGLGVTTVGARGARRRFRPS
jgi:hypothetical protein